MPGDGPIPKRSNQRRRRNAPAGGEITHASAAAPFEPPPADAEWHPIATTWYDSLRTSGQATFYEPSDWATARYIAEGMTRNLNSGRFSGQLFAAVLAGMTELLTTEGARRRARLELERAIGDGPDASVTIMDRYRRAASSSA